MRHSHHDLRRITQRKLDALGRRRQRLLNQRARIDADLRKVERLTQPVMDLLAEIDAQLAPPQPPPVPAATPSIGQSPMRLVVPPRIRVEGA